MVEEDDGVLRWWGHFGSVCTVLGAFLLFFILPTTPPSHDTNLYLLNGLCGYKWTHPEPFDLPILILTFSSFQLEVECWSIVTITTKINAMYGAWFFFSFFFKILVHYYHLLKVKEKKKNVDVDDLWSVCSDSLKGVLSTLLPADKHNVRFSVSSKLIIGSVSCIIWPFHL